MKKKENTEVIMPYREIKQYTFIEVINVATALSIYYERETGFFYNINDEAIISSIIIGNKDSINSRKIKRHIDTKDGIGFFHTHSDNNEPSMMDLRFSMYSEIIIMNCQTLEMARINRDLFHNNHFLECIFDYADKLADMNVKLASNKEIFTIGNALRLRKGNLRRITSRLQSSYKITKMTSQYTDGCWDCLKNKFQINYGSLDTKEFQCFYDKMATKLEEMGK